MREQEGVIKFQLEFSAAASPSPCEGFSSLNAWRTILFQVGLVGQDPVRYGGWGYGNVSMRLPPYVALPEGRRFLITGTQTSGIPELSASHYTVVLESYPDANRVVASGPVRPSSEAMTHGVLYRLEHDLRCVMHVHSPVIWRKAQELHLPTTDAAVTYGTPALAQEVRRLFRDTAVVTDRVFVMGGHEDGVIAFGKGPDEAGCALLKTLVRAMSLAHC